MPKVDLGLVALAPWQSVYEYFEYPISDKYTVKGGYKIIEGICYICSYFVVSSATTLKFPTPKNETKVQYTVNDTVVNASFNGLLAVEALTIVQFNALYEV